MNTVKAWVRALGVPPEQFESWCAQSPDLNLLTFSCLESGSIPTEAYFKWAKEHYGLPVLSKEYLKKDIPKGFWQRLEGIANWSNAFLPVSEWDGVIFIACVEPREDINWSFPVRYVLASPDFLKAFWRKLEDSSMSNTGTYNNALKDLSKTNELSQPAENTGFIMVDNETSKTPDKTGFVIINTDDEKSAPPPIKTPKLDVTEPPNIPSTPEDKTSEAETSSEDIDLNAPIGVSEKPVEVILDFSSLKIQSEESAQQEEQKKETPPPAPPKVKAEISPDGLIHLDEKLNLTPSKPNSKPQASPSPEVSNDFVKLDEDILTAKKIEDSESLKIPPAPAEASMPMPVPKKETAPPQTSSSNYGLANKFFPKLKEEFVGGIVLLFNQNSLVPLEWTPEFKPKAAPQSITNIDDPSAFRIVHRTNKPYLGHVVATEVNKKFFDAWGFDKYPESILIQPVLSNSYLVAIFVALCDPNARTEKNLSKGRDLAKLLCQIFESQSSTAA